MTSTPNLLPPSDHTSSPSAIDRFVSSVEAGRPLEAETLHPDVVLDATVPNWRLHQRGVDPVVGQLAGFYAHPGRYEQLRRVAIPGGELVELTLTWIEDGVPHVSHQAHLIELSEDGRIVADTMFCGGRWPADLLAEMEAADVGA